jgi:hypothetical protein
MTKWLSTMFRKLVTVNENETFKNDLTTELTDDLTKTPTQRFMPTNTAMVIKSYNGLLSTDTAPSGRRPAGKEADLAAKKALPQVWSNKAESPQKKENQKQ